MNALSRSLCSLSELSRSAIWAAGDEPSERTIQYWVNLHGLPRITKGHLVWFSEVDVYSFLLRVCYVAPRLVAQPCYEAARNASSPQLMSLERLLASPIWSSSSVPCKRTVRAWTAHRQIPFFRIGRTIYFQATSVEACLRGLEAPITELTAA
jgi:hypothetical protein